MQFSQFGQPVTITNLGGASNVFVYHDANGYPGYVNFCVNSQLPSLGLGNGRTYRLTNGQYNLQDFALMDDLGTVFLDCNQGYGATLFPLPVRITNTVAATSSGSTNGSPLKFDSEFWDSDFAGTGTVNTSGIAVTQITGNTAFTAAMVGNTITINSVPYTVASFVDGTHITLTTSAGTQTGVSWSATLAASGLDEWTAQTIGGSGSDGTSTLEVTHTGSSGLAGVQFNCPVGFNSTAPIAKPTVTGSKAGNAALASLITALASLGLVTDSTT